MDKVLVDTNVFIDIFKGKHEVLNYLNHIEVYVNPIILMEIYIGAENKNEVRRFEKFFNSFEISLIDNEISLLAIELIKKYSKSHGLAIPDAIIAATCLENSFELFTYNIKDFKFIDNLKLHNHLN
ncbi:MAG: type II toxin-antitoxin system VapC family toxin [Ignavibacteriae bacterium]|nr:type II toxin-antitoxin system VapC family toxin [Ignavibacteriota bacterium]